MARARVTPKARATKSRDASRLVLVVGRDAKARRATAASVAKEDDRSLHRIDLQALLMKYLGETEKALDRVFSDAEIVDALLFFDEADALFGRSVDGVKVLRRKLRGRGGRTLLGARQVAAGAESAVDAVIRVKPKSRKKPKA